MVAQSPNLRSIISRRDNHLLFGYIISKFGRMRLSRISDLQAFVAVVEKASLTSAAHLLGRSLQSVSRSLATIEQDVGVELIRRTTRRSSPTEAGLAYYHRLKTALEDIEESYCVIIFCRLYVAGLAPQQGHRGRIPMSALINRTRTVAIEFGMWRSGRKGGSSGSITFG